MIFTETKLPGVYVIDIEKREDERGFFARSWCQREFETRGLSPRLVQCNISFNERRGTLRGMHYQAPPHEEAKVVRCTRGAAHYAVIDLRVESVTYLRWEAVELSEDNHRMLYVPEGCALGFQTLVDNTEIFYQMSEFYAPASARGVRWDDPAFGILWPPAERIIAERDRGYPNFVATPV